MKTLLKSLSLGAFSLASLVALAPASVSAASITGVSIGGTAPTDFYVYDVNTSNQTVRIPSPSLSDVQRVLDGNATSPTGNVELAASSEQSTFDFTKNTTLQGTIDSKSLILSSLTLSDWNSSYSGTTLGQYWFDQALTSNGLGSLVGTTTATSVFNSFVSNGGFQRFSDPNISYVNQDDTTGLISIGLAGHYNATPLLFPIVPPTLQPLLLGKTIQASELVKYSYDGQTGYLFNFKATPSGLVAADDGVSHTGNYELILQGARPVPVPPALIGIAFAGAIGASMLKRREASKL